MSLRFSLQSLTVKFTKHLIGLKKKCPVIKTYRLTDRDKMEPARKKPKLVIEECELLIEINKKGECSFGVMSKVETVCNGKTDFSAGSESGEGFIGHDGSETASSVDDANVALSDDTGDSVEKNKDNDGDSRIPPTSKYVALDCEFVGTMGDISALGRCSIVNYDEEVIYDIYARPDEEITHYRTRYSGITKAHMKQAIPLECALSQISDIIKDKIVVGHGIDNDFRVLGFGHPKHLIRDTQKCKLLLDKLKQENDRRVSLKNMAKVFLDKEIQKNSHCSVVDATVTMQLFKLVREEWETRLLNKNKRNRTIPDDQDDPSDPADIFVNTIPENNLSDWTGGECKNNLDSMKMLFGIKNGGIKKKQKRNKRSKSLRTHFGQILAGSKTVNDYFKNETKVLNNGRKKIANILEKSFLKTDSKANTIDNIEQNVTVSSSDSLVENDNSHILRDGTRYKSSDFCTDGKAAPKSSKKRKCRFENPEKIALKTVYDRNIKQLFHDDFWNNVDESVDTDTACNIAFES